MSLIQTEGETAGRLQSNGHLCAEVIHDQADRSYTDLLVESGEKLLLPCCEGITGKRVSNNPEALK